MPVQVQGPDGATYSFPDGTDKAAAVAYFKKKGIGGKGPAPKLTSPDLTSISEHQMPHSAADVGREGRPRGGKCRRCRLGPSRPSVSADHGGVGERSPCPVLQRYPGCPPANHRSAQPEQIYRKASTRNGRERNRSGWRRRHYRRGCAAGSARCGWREGCGGSHCHEDRT
jgi:hypothetical protein